MCVCETALKCVFIHKISTYANHTLGINPRKDSALLLKVTNTPRMWKHNILQNASIQNNISTHT